MTFKGTSISTKGISEKYKMVLKYICHKIKTCAGNEPD